MITPPEALTSRLPSCCAVAETRNTLQKQFLLEAKDH